MSTRVYVISESGKATALIRARSPAEAIRHIAGARYQAAVANQDQLIDLVMKGMQVQDAIPQTIQIAGEAS